MDLELLSICSKLMVALRLLAGFFPSFWPVDAALPALTAAAGALSLTRPG